METIGTRIGILRARRGESQQELADSIGVKRETIKFWESNSGRHIKDTDIIKLARHFGVSADYLLGLKEVESPDPDMQAVCAFTGLSQEAVQGILGVRKQGVYLLPTGPFEIFDRLLSAPGLYSFVARLHKVYDLTDAWKNGFPVPYDNAHDEYEALGTMLDNLDIALYRLSETTKQIASDLFGVDEVTKELQAKLTEVVRQEAQEWEEYHKGEGSGE